MPIADIFYLVGIIFFTIYTILMIGILVFIIIAIKKVNEILNTIKYKVKETANVVTAPENIARILGKTAANLLIFRFFRR